MDKPKLFFIQACRGKSADICVVEEDRFGDAAESLYHALPSEADFLFGYATPPGKVAFRSPEHGSFLVCVKC